MQNDWILDTLADMRTFARMNGLDELAETLESTMVVAAREIALLGHGRGADEARIPHADS